MRQTVVFTFIFLCVAVSASSQHTFTGNIQGKISDEALNPVDFANVTLHNSSDSSLVKAALSDENGQFDLENLKAGNYFLQVSHLSFEKLVSAQFLLDSAHNNMIFNELKTTAKSKELGEVKVQAQKQFVERQLDKLVVNVENSIVAAGNSALEVLERSPGVLINQETSINLKGKSGVVVMIDGKPSPLSGSDLINYLRGIPAGSLQCIEIITNPSAKYDAAGNAGIINIRFKKDNRQGLNGSFTASYGQGELPKPAVSTNFNYRKNDWNLFGSVSHSQPKQLARFFINRKFFDQEKTIQNIFEQNSYTEIPMISSTARVGVDYYRGKRTIFGVLLNANWLNQKREGTTNTTVANANNVLDYSTLTNLSVDSDRLNGFGNFNVKHSFNDKGTELSADIDYGQFDAITLQNMDNQNFTPDNTLLTISRLASDQRGVISVTSAKADFTHAFSETLKFESGWKSSLVSSDNDLKFYDVIQGLSVLDPQLSNQFLYRELINALYLNASTSRAKFDVQAGLRMEHTNTLGQQVTTNDEFKRNYAQLFPSMVVNWKQSDNHQVSVSYSKRIDRPNYQQLNPFRVFVDTYTYVVGDPGLQPVITHSFELNHTLQGKYMTTLSYTHAKESITDIFTQDDETKISYQIPANIQTLDQLALGIFYPFNFGKKISSTLSGNMYWNRYESPLQGGNLVNERTSWDLNLNNNFSLGKGWSAELTAFYQSRTVWGQFIIKQLGQVSAGVQKVSNDKKSIFKASLSDIFLTNHISVVVQYENQDFFTRRTWDRRVLSLSYTYRFGKNTVTKARQRSTGAEDLKKRAG
jgi:iron complex outermembrane recepter protein